MELLDLIARPLGWLVALAVSIGVIGTCIAIGFAPYMAARRRAGRLRSIIAWLLAGPLMGAAALVLWRVARFAGGYIGSSEFPLQHVFRLFS